MECVMEKWIVTVGLVESPRLGFRSKVAVSFASSVGQIVALACHQVLGSHQVEIVSHDYS